MRTVYNLECVVVDKLGRAKQTKHVGVYSSLEEVENAKQTLLKATTLPLKFEVYFIEHIFS